jgi:hypothetical protein
MSGKVRDVCTKIYGNLCTVKLSVHSSSKVRIVLPSKGCTGQGLRHSGIARQIADKAIEDVVRSRSGREITWSPNNKMSMSMVRGPYFSSRTLPSDLLNFQNGF